MVEKDADPTSDGMMAKARMPDFGDIELVCLVAKSGNLKFFTEAQTGYQLFRR